MGDTTAKVALIAGANKGIGLETARQLGELARRRSRPTARMHDLGVRFYLCELCRGETANPLGARHPRGLPGLGVLPAGVGGVIEVQQ